MSTLQIGKAIRAILADIEKVYPLVADEGTTFPFVVYRRSSLVPSSTKDRYNYQEKSTIEIAIASDNYSEGIELAEKIKTILEHKRGTYNDIKIGDITLVDADEDYIENTFIQRLVFEINII